MSKNNKAYMLIEYDKSKNDTEINYVKKGIVNDNSNKDILSNDDKTNIVNDLILTFKDTGWSAKEVSDKWHTFDELYYHRMILFLVIQKEYPELAWKSKQHHDGTMFDDSFVVGIETPEGQYSYHYNLEHWDLFKDIKELDKAPEFDGHKPSDITRLLSLI